MTGMSGAGVHRVEIDGIASAFLKTGTTNSEADLSSELARLLWLQERLPVPRVLYFAELEGTQYMLTEALPGIPVHEARDRFPEVIALYGNALRLVHGLPVDGCPFDERQDVKLLAARCAVAAGLVRTDLFDADRLGRSPESLYEELISMKPPAEDLVFTHGDYCAPNILVDPSSLELSGFVDLGRAGISDRYQDLALAARSIAFNFGPEWVQPFFDSYGISEPDESKIAFYKLLDEFF